MSNCLVELKNITLEYKQPQQRIFHQLNYCFVVGSQTMLVGANGSGKSSLLKLIDRRLRPNHGAILFEQQKHCLHNPRQWSKAVKTLTQNSHDVLFPQLTVAENCAIFLRASGQKLNCVASYLQQYHQHLGQKLAQLVCLLSGGEQQVLALALIFLQPPKLLLLDEHTAALDPKQAEKIMQLTAKMVEQHQTTCIGISHDVTLARQFSYQLITIQNGQLLKIP